MLAALRMRDRDGRGRFVDLAMLDSLVNLLWDEPLDHYEDSGIGERFGNSDPRAGPIGSFATTDGYVAMVLTDDEQWLCLCERMERPDLATHSRATRRGAVLGELNATVAEWCRGRSTDEAVAALDACGLPAGPVRPPWTARHDPHLAQRGALEPLGHSALAEPTAYLGPRLPFRIGDVEFSTTPAETLGASTDAVLREVCGLDDDELARLRADGIIGGPAPT